MFGRILALFVVAFILASTGGTAHAKWHKAESDRFVIYSDSSADDLVEFGEMLERYHVAMELESGRQLPVPSPSNRLTIYLVGSIQDLRELYGAPNSSIGGFYIPRANGSVAFAPNIRHRTQSAGRRRIGTRYRRGSGAKLNFSATILLHEYAHHFLISSSRHAMPRWLSEGAAEYFASAHFNDDGSVDIGLPNNDRAWEISQAGYVSVPELLDHELYRERSSGRYDAFYGRSWLLFHYLRFNPERAGQLGRYWHMVASGADSLEAGRQVFGDLERLDDELRSYGRERSMAGMRFSAEDIAIGPVTARELSEGHADMMDVILQSNRGVSREEALELLPDARRTAERYPNDAHVRAALAEAEYDAGNDDAAIAAARRAIAIDPDVPNAYVQQGYALFRQAKDTTDKDAAYAAAMKPFEALNALETDHTQPLIYYYRSYAERGLTPPESAKHAMERATQLAPFDKDLAIEVAFMKAADGQVAVARYLLAPVAADPHGGDRAEAARLAMDHLASIPDGRSVVLRAEDFEDDEATGGGTGED